MRQNKIDKSIETIKNIIDSGNFYVEIDYCEKIPEITIKDIKWTAWQGLRNCSWTEIDYFVNDFATNYPNENLLDNLGTIMANIALSKIETDFETVFPKIIIKEMCQI